MTPRTERMSIEFRRSQHRFDCRLEIARCGQTMRSFGRDEISSLCRAIQEDDYCPNFTVIDRDDAERNAIEQVFPELAIRVCQFHLVQARRSKARLLFGRSPPGEAKTRAFLGALRKCQQCPIETGGRNTINGFDKTSTISPRMAVNRPSV